MSVIQYPTPIPATVGTLPNLKFMVSSDSLTAVTTAGYLNSANTDSATPISNGDIIMGLYSYNTSTTSGTFGIFTVSITASTGITLTSWANPGDAVLPTTSGRFAVFTDATGTITSAAGNAVQLGNITAGASGTAGTLTSYPATSSKGSLIIAGGANTGNTTTTVSNVAMGQASVISIPDPANAVGRLLIGATATPFTSGNFVQASGTGGLVVDSGISSATSPLLASITLSASQINAMWTTPVQVIAAPGSGKAILVTGLAWDFVYGSAAFTAGGLVTLQYKNTTEAGGVVTTTGIAATSVTGVTANSVLTDTVIPIVATSANTVNQGIFISNATQAFATGTGTTTTLTVFYRVISAT